MPTRRQPTLITVDANAMPLAIVLFVVFIACSAFFSASETAIFSLSNIKLRRLSEGCPKAKLLIALLRRPTRLLAAIVFGNLLVNIGFASLSTTLCVRMFGQQGLAVAVLASGVIILFFGEVFPKTFAIYTAERLSLFLVRGIHIFSRIFLPFIISIEHLVTFFSSFLIRKPVNSSLSDEEFRAALLLSKKDGQISAEEEEMIGSVLEFKETQASEILTARIDIAGIDAEMSQSQVLEFLRQTKHSKFPVYENSLDNIIGTLYAKDVFCNMDADYHSLLHKPIFVPESKKIDDILRIFLENNERIAIVLDEYGGTEGILTFEDIVEEIFGEIYDEFETPQEPVEPLDARTWRVFGKTALKAINAELDIVLPEDEDTIAGFLLARIERIPRPGEEFSFSTVRSITGKPLRLRIRIERATARRIVSMIAIVEAADR